MKWSIGPPTEPDIYWIVYSINGYDKVLTIARLFPEGKNIILFGGVHSRNIKDLNISHHIKLIYPELPGETQ